MRLCSSCGESNEDDAVFCASCNYFLEWVEESPAAAPPRRTPAAPQPVSAHPPAPIAPVPAPRQAAPSPPPSPPQSPPPQSPPPQSPPPQSPPPQSPPHQQPARLPTPPPQQLPTPPSDTDDFSREQQLVHQALAGLDRGRALAVAKDRTDLASTLDGARARLDDRSIGVAVVGEFKRGKSTLVNALLQTAVCPVDADEVTVVPTIVRYGETAGATAHFEAAGEDGEPRTQDVPIDAVAQWVSESGNPGNRRGLRSVEIRLPRRLLRVGLCLIDTPGVGGLDSAHGIITLGALDTADGMLFVTDASQELTEPELDFLQQAMRRCPRAACVVTKTDLYPGWRRIVSINENHLKAAGLDLPVIAVSSFLRLGARRDPSLLEESGYAGLVEFLGRGVLRAANARAAVVAARDVDFVAEQIGQQIEAEKSVLTEPARAQQVVAQLATAQGRTAGLVSPTATWQQVLSDGVQDLVADVEHDLQGRLRAVLRDVEAIIDAGDPKNAWPDIEVWLRRHVVAAAVDNSDTLAARTTELANEVSERFNLDAGGPVIVQAEPPTDMSGVNLAAVESLSAPGGRFGSMIMATRSAVYVPMVLFSVASATLGILVAAPLSLVLAAGIGQKIIRDEKKRQVAHRRQQAKMAARRYIEEVGFTMNKESRDALRRTQRFLRDDFQLRALSMHRSSTSALGAAKQAMELTGPARSARVSQLASEANELRQVDAQVARLVAAAPAGAEPARG